MATKGKKARAAEVQHLNEAQFSELPRIAREFLIAGAGGREAALRLKPKKIREYAHDFLYEDGAIYWPLSEMGQWQYDPSQVDVEKWIADLMTRERSHQNVVDSTIVVDDPMEGPSSGQGAKTPGRIQNRTPKRITLLKSPVEFAQNSRTSRHSTDPTQDVVPTVRLSKSPTVAPDVPYTNKPETSEPTSRKSIRPTPESIKIANEKFEGSSMAEPSPSGEVERPPKVGLGLRMSPKTPRKRVAAESVDDEASIPTPITAERQAKRPNLGSMVSPQISGVDIESQVEDFGLLASRTSEARTAPERRDHNFSPPADGNKDTESLTTVAAHGLCFTVERLAKVPEEVLGYITECVHHQIRLANNTNNSSLQREYRARSTIFQNMHADLESRIKCLAQDAEEKGRVESSHCMWI